MHSNEKRLIHLSKFLSLLLRHKPNILNLEMNEQGFVEFEELSKKISQKSRWEWVKPKILKQVVKNDPKDRFELQKKPSGEGARIRATYGHSDHLPISIGYPLMDSKNKRFLYHGTKSRFLPSILKDGLRSKSRKYVHLAADKKTARKVAGRREGKSLILRILAKELMNSGKEIFKATDTLFLCKWIPPKFIEVETPQ